MKTAIVIPARYASTRYPGKPLAGLKGATGRSKTLIERSWEAACRVSGVDQVVIATDDSRIADEGARLGARVVMTSETCANGTERCADALDALDGAEVIVNLQGDAPLTPPWFVEALIETLRDRPEVQVATPVLRCDPAALGGFIEDRRAGRVGGTTAVFDCNGRALYFSKEVIPYTGVSTFADTTPVFHHVGVYAYRPQVLRDYVTLPMGALERLEGLEQLRFMESGLSVHCVEVAAKGVGFWELNNPEDVPRIEKMLSDQGIA